LLLSGQTARLLLLLLLLGPAVMQLSLLRCDLLLLKR
jgi:hypothetical protein